MAQSVARREVYREGMPEYVLRLALGNRGDQDVAKQDRSVMCSSSDIALRSAEIEKT